MDVLEHIDDAITPFIALHIAGKVWGFVLELTALFEGLGLDMRDLPLGCWT